MDTLVLIIIGAGISIAIAVLLVMRRARAVPGKYAAAVGVHEPVPVTRNAPPKRAKHFYGVAVRPGVNCCDAIKAIARNRYLQGEAPELPLPDCDRDDCRCVMYPENDRRTPIDRRDDAFSAYGDYRPGWHPRRRHEAPERRKR